LGYVNFLEARGSRAEEEGDWALAMRKRDEKVKKREWRDIMCGLEKDVEKSSE